MSEEAFPRAVTARRVADGAVVYLAAGGAWRETPVGCRVAAGAQEGAAMTLLARWAAQAGQVVAPRIAGRPAPPAEPPQLRRPAEDAVPVPAGARKRDLPMPA